MLTNPNLKLMINEGRILDYDQLQEMLVFAIDTQRAQQSLENKVQPTL